MSGCSSCKRAAPVPLSDVRIAGVAFEGGGTRSPPHDFAVIVLALKVSKKTVPQLFKRTKYFGGNSGGSWTSAVLMTYPQLVTNPFPLDEVASNPSEDYWRDFFSTFWLDKVKSAPQIPSGLFAFEAFTLENQVEFSWLNSLAAYFMYPFVQDMSSILLRDAQFARDENKVVTFAAAVMYNSYIRFSIPITPTNPDPTDYVEYTWNNPLRTPVQGVDVQGGPCNIIFGYANTPVEDIKRFEMEDTGTVVYSQKRSNITVPIVTTLPRSVPNPMASGAGDISVYDLSAVSSASLSFLDTNFALTHIIPDAPTGPTNAEIILTNYNSFNKCVLYDPTSDSVVSNSTGAPPIYPPTQPYVGAPAPYIDNGLFGPAQFADPDLVYLNLGDGVPFANNSGLIPVVRAIQGFEKDSSKTYDLLYVGDHGLRSCLGESLGFDAVFTSLFGLDFENRTNTFSDGVYTRHNVLGFPLPPGVALSTASPQIFPQAAFFATGSWPSSGVSCTYDAEAWPGLEGINTAVRIVQLTNLKSVANAAYGIKAGWSFSITAILTYSELGVLIPASTDPFQPLNQANKKLMAQLQFLDVDSRWISRIFGGA